MLVQVQFGMFADPLALLFIHVKLISSKGEYRLGRNKYFSYIP